MTRIIKHYLTTRHYNTSPEFRSLYESPVPNRPTVDVKQHSTNTSFNVSLATFLPVLCVHAWGLPCFVLADWSLAMLY